jgi:hypothetical protein
MNVYFLAFNAHSAPDDAISDLPNSSRFYIEGLNKGATYYAQRRFTDRAVQVASVVPVRSHPRIKPQIC